MIIDGVELVVTDVLDNVPFWFQGRCHKNEIFDIQAIHYLWVCLLSDVFSDYGVFSDYIENLRDGVDL